MNYLSIVLTLITITCVKSVVILQVNSDYKICNKVTYLDLSDLEIIPVNDSLTVLNGGIGFLKNIPSPIRVTIRTERFDRGQWVPGEYNRFIKDFCQVLHNTDEAWTKITSKFKNQNCEFKAGVTIYDFGLLILLIKTLYCRLLNI